MKRILIALLSVLLLVFPLAVSAENGSQRVIDNAGLLTDSQKNELEAKLDELSEALEYDIVILTDAERLIGSSAISKRTTECYESRNYGFGEDKTGSILYVNVTTRDWWVESYGEGADIIYDPESDIAYAFVDSLSDGDYYEAFDSFADELSRKVEDSRKFPLKRWIIISVVVGAIAAFSVTSVMKAKLKSVGRQVNARQYVRAGSFVLNTQRDLYLYSTVTRTPRPKSNSHGGGGGSRGGGGKF